MKKLTIIGLAISLICLCQPALPAEKGLTRISDFVYAYQDVKEARAQNSFGANAGVIIGKDFLVAVDSLMSAREARRFIKDIRKISPKPIRFLINTHYHLDHSLGNSEFAKLGAVIVAQDHARENLKKSGAGMLQYARKSGLSAKDLQGTRVTYPNLTFRERLTLDLGNTKIEVIYPGPSHTTGSVLVYLPQEKVLFSGDILFTAYHPFMGEANLEGWIKVLDKVMGLEVEKIIPGHGPVSTKKDLADLRLYLLTFDKKAKELTAKSSDLNFIVLEMKKALPPRPQLDGLIGRNIQMKYLPPPPPAPPQGK